MSYHCLKCGAGLPTATTRHYCDWPASAPAPVTEPSGETATPRTDAELLRLATERQEHVSWQNVSNEFARTLERELASVTAERNKWRKDYGHLLMHLHSSKMALELIEVGRFVSHDKAEQAKAIASNLAGSPDLSPIEQERDSLRAQLEEAREADELFDIQLAAAQAKIAELEAIVARLTTTIQNNPTT